MRSRAGAGILTVFTCALMAACAGMQHEDDVTKKVAHLRQDVDGLTQQQKRLTDEIAALRKDLQAYYEPTQEQSEGGRASTGLAAAPAPQVGQPAETAPAPVPVQVPPPAKASRSADDPAALYKQAIALMEEGQYPQAREAFQAFIVAHPQSALADNAQYWTGECFYSQREYRAAWDAFRAVLLQYPDGNKLSDALLKIGMCQAQLGQGAESQATYKKVVQDYPDSLAAQKAKKLIK